MKTRSSKRKAAMKRFSHALALLGVTAVALAASPAALADDRGGPGAPKAQQLSASVFLPVIRQLPLRFVSWSD